MRALLLVFAACGTEYVATPDAAPSGSATTWFQDVAPIVATKCTGCHQSGGIAPFALTDPDSAKEHAGMVITEIDSGAMPPFDAREESGAAGCTPRFGWKDDGRLSAQEKQIIHAWVDGGYALGTPVAMPAPPATSLAVVDKTIQPAQPFVASGSRDQFMCTIMDPQVTAAVTWIKGLQVRPGNALVVHHVVVTALQPGSDTDAQLAAHPVGTTWNCDNEATPGSGVMNIWTPGNTPLQTPDQLAIPLQAGGKVAMQIHYHPNGTTAAPDSTAIDLQYSTVWPQKMYFVTALGNAPDAANGLQPDPDDTGAPAFMIPKNKSDHTETMVATIPDISNLGDVRLYSVNPHMHLVGTHIQGEIARGAPASGQPAQECLANGGWNFDWQRTYTYDAPLAQLPQIQTGDKLTVKCHWDNTIANPFVQRMLHDAGLGANPVDISLGEQTTNEMCLEIFGLALDAPANPAAVVKKLSSVRAALGTSSVAR